MEGRVLSKVCCVRLKSILRARHFSSCSNFRSSIKNVQVGPDETHFGFKTVSETEKEHKVYEVFHNVAEKYDVMNDVMSAGIHRLWKDYFVERLGPVPGSQIIDAAGGTGDIAFRCLDHMKHAEEDGDNEAEINYADRIMGFEEQDSSEQPNTSHITVCDINQAMLNVGKARAEKSGYREGLTWLKGNAECLPVSDNTYDAYTIAFGIRNTTHIDKVLLEAHRVLKPGGRFMCLEFSEVNNNILKKFYDEYSFQVIPVMGKVVAGDWHSYQYLVESIRKFPKQENFASMIRLAGFKAVHYENLMVGVAAIHSGYKL